MKVPVNAGRGARAEFDIGRWSHDEGISEIKKALDGMYEALPVSDPPSQLAVGFLMGKKYLHNKRLQPQAGDAT
ncbi:MAG: hypothetical protein Q8L23_01060 [Caulobacter sp.]|nr:hypothetical protein [Caulobacter sp.]